MTDPGAPLAGSTAGAVTDRAVDPVAGALTDPAAGPVLPVCVLVGPPGAGKSTIATMLTETLGVELRDTDAEIERAEGKPISEIFVDDGEEHFRRLESAAVRGAMSGFGGVVAVGGGAVLAEANRMAMAGREVVYLTVDLAEAVSRVGMGQGRPLLAVNPRATLRYLMEQRRPLYEQVATITVDTTGRTPEQVVAEIVRRLAGQD